MSDYNKNNNNEILFWKVINNKYLFNHIFHFIHTIEWIDYDNIEQIHIDNRIRFKNITSLYWMFEKNQFELLKCKLIAGEYIEIKEFNLKILIEYENTCKNLKNENNNNNQDQNQQQQQKQQVKIKYCKEILELILKYKSNEIKGFDLLSILIKNNSLTIDFINLIKSTSPIPESFLTVLPNTLEWVISNSSANEINLLLNSPNNDITIKGNYSLENLKNKSISLAIRNIKYSEEMLEFILNHSNQFYSIPTPPTSSSNSNNIIKLQINQIFSIHSNDIIIQLIKLNYFNFDKLENENQIYEIIKRDDQSNYEKVKEIHQIISNLDESLKLKYEIRYDNRNGEIYKEYLKFIKIEENKEFIRYFKDEYKFKPLNQFNKESVLQFIKIYTSLFASTVIDDIIIMYICNLDNKEDYDNAINSISLKINGDNLPPIKWNHKLKEIINNNTVSKIIIKDKETIDWLLNTIDENNAWFNKLFRHHSFLNLLYESIVILDYAIETFKFNQKLTISLNSNFEISKYYSYIFISSILNFKIQVLKEIDQILELKQIELPQPIQLFYDGSFEFKFSNQLSIATPSNFNQLLNYLYLNGFKWFSNALIETLIYSIINHPVYDLSIIEIDKYLDNIKFDIFKSRLISLTFSSKIYQIIFKSNKLNSYKNKTQEYNSNLKRYTFTNIFYSKYNDTTIDEFIECIELTIKEYYNESDNNNNGTSSSNCYLSFLENLLKFQFYQFIQIKEIPFKKLNYIYNLVLLNDKLYFKTTPHENDDDDDDLILFNQNEQKQLSTVYSIHFLRLKSIKLMKYITQFPYDTKSNINTFTTKEIKEIKHKYKDLNYYIDSTIFTFDFIFNSSFDQVLDKLINRLSNETIDQNVLNYNLIYFLEIHRNDLFFKELEFIKQLQQQQKYQNINFKFSKKLIEIINKLFNNDDDLFQSLTQYF